MSGKGQERLLLNARIDVLFDVSIVVAQIFGPLKIEAFTDETWKACCELQKRLAEMTLQDVQKLNSLRS